MEATTLWPQGAYKDSEKKIATLKGQKKDAQSVLEKAQIRCSVWVTEAGWCGCPSGALALLWRANTSGRRYFTLVPTLWRQGKHEIFHIQKGQCKLGTKGNRLPSLLFPCLDQWTRTTNISWRNTPTTNWTLFRTSAIWITQDSSQRCQKKWKTILRKF